MLLSPFRRRWEFRFGPNDHGLLLDHDRPRVEWMKRRRNCVRKRRHQRGVPGILLVGKQLIWTMLLLFQTGSTRICMQNQSLILNGFHSESPFKNDKKKWKTYGKTSSVEHARFPELILHISCSSAVSFQIFRAENMGMISKETKKNLHGLFVLFEQFGREFHNNFEKTEIGRLVALLRRRLRIVALQSELDAVAMNEGNGLTILHVVISKRTGEALRQIAETVKLFTERVHVLNTRRHLNMVSSFIE